MEGTEKRKRGRPRKNSTSAETDYERGIIGEEYTTTETEKGLVENNIGLVPNVTSIDIFEAEEKPKKKEVASKPKKSNNKNKQETTQDIATLIQIGFSLLSLGVNPCWEIGEIEAQSIAKPLTNILERYNLFEKVAGMSDTAMLLTSLGIVMTPRILTTIKDSKTKKGVKVNVESRKAENNSEQYSQSNRENERPTNDGEISISPIKALSIATTQHY